MMSLAWKKKNICRPAAALQAHVDFYYAQSERSAERDTGQVLEPHGQILVR